MSLDDFGGNFEPLVSQDDDDLLIDEPLNGTDTRRRLEAKIEAMRLMKEVREFDFDL